MDEQEVEKIFDYVSDMAEHESEYDVSPLDVVGQTKAKNSKVSGVIKKIYCSKHGGKAVCEECEIIKLYDERQEEYYCPTHDGKLR